MKNKISKTPFSKAFHFTFVLIAVLAGLCAGSLPAAAQARQIVLVPGTVTVSNAMQAAVVTALQNAVDLPSNALYFAITDLRLERNWALASVVGLARVHAGQTWSLEKDAAWTGVVLLKRGSDNRWAGSTQGAPSFSALIDEAPDTFLGGKAKEDLDPRRRPSTQTLSATAYSFPWQPGTSMLYGSFGVHANGFASVVDGWKAVDMMSDGDTSAGHAPNRLLAAEAGTISYKCTDPNNLAIHLGDFFYTHLANNTLNNSTLLVGSSFVQAADLGRLKTGNFSGPCGWASQPSGWFHVHWGFPNANLTVEDWTLNISTQKWTNGTSTVTKGSGWILAGGTNPCTAPSRSAPADGTISASQTISFSWLPLSACAFNGYNFRVKTVPTMDSDGITIVDVVNSLPSRTQTISSDWNHQDLYWGVKAANAPFGASWSVGQFRIDPGNAVPTDYGYCTDEGQRCAFSGLALIYYGASDHFVGPLPFTDGVDCSNSVFGDPMSGTSNQCFIRGGRPEGSSWCMNQGGTCSFGPGNLATVYYGVNGQYKSQTDVLDSVSCNSTAFGGDPFPALTKACYYIVTDHVTPATKTFASNAFQDGWILESGATSSIGGTKDSTATTLRLGDDSANRQYRAILSFPTGGLPDNAVITSVTLKIMKAALTGSDPFDSMGSILGDIQTGAFGSYPSLQPGDWQATASQKKAFTIPNTPAGGWYSGTLNSSYFGYVNLTGITQVRLRFSPPDNGNATADYLEFYTSNYTTTLSYRPRIVITYYVPN